MKQVPDRVVAAVADLRTEGWITSNLLNVAEFIDVQFNNARVYEIGSAGDVIASYLAGDERNIVDYANYVIG